MRYLLALACLALGLVVFGVSSAMSKAPPSPVTVATFPAGTFAESLALDGQGNMYVTVTDWASAQGYLTVIAADGTQTQLGPALPVGWCCLTGVALDSHGRVYVAVAPSGDPEAAAPAVYRFDPTASWTEVLRLPVESFANGLAFHGRWLYVSDSTLGAIWRTDPAGFTDATSQRPWLEDAELLAPEGFGANGLAFWKDDLYVAVADAGSILRVPIGGHGMPGTATVVVQDAALVTADGISFDQTGNLYVTVNGGDPTQGPPMPSPALFRLTPKGALEQIAGLDLAYTTMAVFGTTPATATTLYVENGDAYGVATTNIIALGIGSRGLPLPQ